MLSIGHLCSFLVVFPVLWTPVSAEIPENQAPFFIAFLALISAFFTVFGCQFLGLIYFGIRLGREKARTSILAQDEKYLLGLEDALISRVKTLKEEVEEEKTVCQKMMKLVVKDRKDNEAITKKIEEIWNRELRKQSLQYDLAAVYGLREEHEAILRGDYDTRLIRAKKDAIAKKRAAYALLPLPKGEDEASQASSTKEKSGTDVDADGDEDEGTTDASNSMISFVPRRKK